MSTFCQSAYKKLPCINFSHKPKFQSLKSAEGFLYEIVSKEAQYSNIVAAILNRTYQQLDCVFVTSFCLRDFVQMASKEPFNYHSGLIWLLLSHTILSQTYPKLEMIALEIVTVTGQICLEIHLERLKL